MHKYVFVAGFVAMSGVAVAHEAGDVVLRVGVAHSDPVSSSSKIKMNGTKQRESGVSTKGDNDTQVGLSATYMIMPRFGIDKF
ncbi:MAG: hypothetical protein FWH56_05980 [Betaproteobacteria bacterium]|nr:hypothetical protein [Betaproteobacteria bacterium]